MGERPKIATADELVAKELRKAIRRKARVADLVSGHEDEIRKLDQEDKALEKAIRGLRDNLTSEFDADGNPVEIDA